MVVNNITGCNITLSHLYSPLTILKQGESLSIFFNCADDHVSIHTDFGSCIISPLVNHVDWNGCDVLELNPYCWGDIKCFGGLIAEDSGIDNTLVLRRKQND